MPIRNLSCIDIADIIRDVVIPRIEETPETHEVFRQGFDASNKPQTSQTNDGESDK